MSQDLLFSETLAAQALELGSRSGCTVQICPIAWPMCGSLAMEAVPVRRKAHQLT